MKNFILIISLLLSGIAFGQNTNSPSPPPTTSKYPIYNNSNTSVDVLAIYENPDQMPDFPDGVLAFRTKFQNAIVLDSFRSENGENTLKGLISFVIERDGSMTDLKVTGSNEKFNAEVKKAVRSIKEKWMPGKIKGETVRSRYRIPLTINIS